MSGRHAAARTPRDLLPLLAASLLAIVLIGAAILATRRDGASPAMGTDPVATSADRPARAGGAGPAPTGGAAVATPPSTPTGTPDRAGRGQARAAPTPSATAGPSRPVGGGTVVGSGQCEVSYYDEPQPTASGEPFDPEAYTAAHKTLPFNTRVRVTNLANGKSVVVRINDRGPYIDGRCIDLARAPFRDIASLSAGVIDARYEVLG